MSLIKKIISFAIIIFLVSGCSMEDLGFEKTNGTGLDLTLEKYEKIENGSSYEDVISIVGGKCDNYYTSETEDWYTCIDDKDEDKRIVLKFENNKLTKKSSSGLK